MYVYGCNVYESILHISDVEVPMEVLFKGKRRTFFKVVKRRSSPDYTKRHIWSTTTAFS